ncbi:MAG: hypothetical protein GY941_19835 [Planctomycetes bacterium]|nr:hypothetical protein [Planctomycetota bacterium]
MTQGTLGQLMQKYKDDMLSIARISCSVTSTMVVDGSPVLTGSFRNSWNASIGGPVVNNVTIGFKKGMSPMPVRNNHTSTINSLQLGDVYSVVNGQPYARRIEYEGWSSFAKGGVLAPAVAKWDSTVKSSIGSL